MMTGKYLVQEKAFDTFDATNYICKKVYTIKVNYYIRALKDQ